MNPRTHSIVALCQEKGLDPGLLYESVIELADEGLLTAGCINAAGGILLRELGLPKYFFQMILKENLKRILRTIAGNLQRSNGEFVLLSEVSEARFDVEGGVQARIATPENRDRMEAILASVMTGNRIEYYYGKERQYYTYLIHSEHCKRLSELADGESPFAFGQIAANPALQQSTRQRYEAFMKKCNGSVIPLISVTRNPPTKETRIMFKEDFYRSPLPVIRRMFADLGITINRAYWEVYRGSSDQVESICSLYLDGYPLNAKLQKGIDHLQSLLSTQSVGLDDFYVGGFITFDEYIFVTVASSFVHTFIHKDLPTDRNIMEGLNRKDHRDALAQRIFDSSRSEYTRKYILQTVRQQPALVKNLYRLFDLKFHPRRRRALQVRERHGSGKGFERDLAAFHRQAEIAFVDDNTGRDIFVFMSRIVTCTLKTNFYKIRRRSCAFRLSPEVLDPLVFPSPVHGVFFVAGFYATATHMRSDEIARGGVRLIRVTPGNYEVELDNMPLLNYALGPVAQRLKHKDIAESGAKGVVVPGVEYAGNGLNAVLDFTDGIMDLVQPSEEVVDYLGKPEMIFLGPDEGTAKFMDTIACRARERGYKYWRTLTTGKSFGIPHDAYGLTRDGRVFALLAHENEATELQIDGETALITDDTGKIYRKIGNRIDASGMTTMGVAGCLRTVLQRLGMKERETRLMITGGPDGDLGANQIQSFRGKICIVIDGGSVLFDPDGLNRCELVKIALARHTRPRLNSVAYPEDKLGVKGFKIPRTSESCTLPDGTWVEDGSYFHRTFLSDSALRDLIAQAGIQVFVPCGGLKDTINANNVRPFLELFRELQVIVEGANVFFDDTAREMIARKSGIVQIRDSSANKGGVTSSSVAEVLPAFLLAERYDEVFVNDLKFKSELVRCVFALITRNAVAETEMLLNLHARTGTPLYQLSVDTSEQLLVLQKWLFQRLDLILQHSEIVSLAVKSYVPGVLVEKVGIAGILRILGNPEMQAYRNAVLTKSIAATALYQNALEWTDFLSRLQSDPIEVLHETLMCSGDL